MHLHLIQKRFWVRFLGKRSGSGKFSWFPPAEAFAEAALRGATRCRLLVQTPSSTENLRPLSFDRRESQ